MYHILIADDDEISRSMLRAILEADAYKVTLARDGGEAIDKLNSDSFSCLLLDLHMPVYDGFQVLEYMDNRKLIEKLPVIIISGDDSGFAKDKAFEMGASDVIQKPFNRNLITRRVEHIIKLREQREQVSEFRKIISYDEMTGLLNKKTFFNMVEIAIAEYKQAAFFMIDIDGLKAINDTMGHAAGDKMIAKFGSILSKHFGNNSILAHLSGDEFAVVLPGVFENTVALEQAENLSKAIGRDFYIPNQTRVLTASIGVALYPAQAKTINNLYIYADYAMLYVKNHGRNGYKLYERRDNLQEDSVGRLDCTFSQFEQLLKSRSDEEDQLWVRYGHFRMIWNSFKAKKYGTIASALLTIRRKNMSQDMDKNHLIQITDKITDFIKESKHPGVFTWYSSNELLMISYEALSIEKVVKQITKAVNKELERGGLEIVSKTKYLNNDDNKNNPTREERTTKENIRRQKAIESVTRLVFSTVLDVDLDRMDYRLYSNHGGNGLTTLSQGDYNQEVQRFIHNDIHKDDTEKILEVESPSSLISAYASNKNYLSTKFRQNSEGRWKWMESLVIFDKVEGVPHAHIIDREDDGKVSSLLDISEYATTLSQNEKLRARHDTNQRLIDILATLVESRDMESGLHIRRIKKYTEILAMRIATDYPEYDLDSEKVTHIVSASAMHDVGKISIPDSILLKPGRLTSEEFEIMKKHSVRGGEIIRKIAGMQDDEYTAYCYDISRYHHERYDGKGYPNGLIGDEIPISAQIVSIADAYDALVTERVYKRAYAPDKAYYMIMTGECGVYNPKLLDCFKKSKGKFEAVLNDKMNENWNLDSSPILVNKHMLIIDSTPVDGKILKNIIECTGASANICKTVEAGMEAIKLSTEGYYDMIFLEVGIKCSDSGYKLAEKIRLTNRYDVKRVPIVVIFDREKEVNRKQLRDSGIDYALIRPIKPTNTNACLDYCLIQEKK